MEVADQLRLENELKRVKRLQEEEQLSRVKRFNDPELLRQKRMNENSDEDALKRVKRLKRAVLEKKLKEGIALHRMKRGKLDDHDGPVQAHAQNKLSKEQRTKLRNKGGNRELKRRRMEMAMRRHGQLGEHRVMKKGDPRFHPNRRHGQFRKRMMKHRRFNGSDKKHAHQIRNILKRHHIQHHRNDVKKPKRHIKRS